MILSEQQDFVIVQMNLNKGGLEPLESDGELQIIVQAPAGGNTYVSVTAPRQINGGESYIL